MQDRILPSLYNKKKSALGLQNWPSGLAGPQPAKKTWSSPSQGSAEAGPAVNGHRGAKSPTVCQVSWTMPAFSDRISMSCWASPSLNTMLLMLDTSVL